MLFRSDGGDLAGAIATLQGLRPGAKEQPGQRALLAALLLRAQRFDEAVTQYRIALRQEPEQPQWLVGLGVSLEGLGRGAEAVEAYRLATRAPDLNPDTAQFLSDRLGQLRR